MSRTHNLLTIKHPKKKAFLEALKTAGLNATLHEVETYCTEGEHQDGIGFWDYFQDAGEVMEDFIRYRKGVLEEIERQFKELKL